MAPTGSDVGLAVLLAAAVACAGPARTPASPPPPGAGGAAAPASAPNPPAPSATAPLGTAPREPIHVVASHLPATHSGGLYIAAERGYLAEQGLDVDLQPSFASSEALTLLNS